MKYHKVVNNNKEDVAVKCRFSNIEYRIRHPYTFEYLDGLSGYIEDYTKFLKTLTLKVPEELKYKPGTKYARSTIVVHNSQVFVVIAENGTTREPFPYSDDWIALTDSYGNKCVAVTKYEEGGGATDDTFESVNYGNFGLQDMTDILINGKYYDYFNDGDYMIIFDRSGNKFTMRMNYREYVNEGGTTNASVDFVSDELIPDIVINPNDTFGIESDGVKYINNFSNVPIHKFSMVPDRLDTFVYQLPNALLGLLKNKYGYYSGYDRSKRISNDGVYIHNHDHMNGFYLPNGLDGGQKHSRIEQLAWLPTATEVFGGIPFRRPNEYAFNIETGFKQLPSLDTAFKRVKTLNGRPKNWMIYTIESGTKYPCVVNEDGTRLPMRLSNSNGFSSGDKVYVPLCFTMGDTKISEGN